ncbi:FkbM family methyltransferase [Aureimonas altamirensis]|uniref:FkbM family methyltransferase n=1 Tax=Aureimonas altamirensis TaxID=370622 RepID=UPI0020367EE5|nr:FkbM family methyltransferase [Aureimonas altamirensis]MCM2502159.1 FkbM family methyltransferase [Aureimonas altamirensis]
MGGAGRRQSDDAPYLSGQDGRGEGAGGLARFSVFVGLVRSLVIYRARPWKDRALRRFFGSFVNRGDLVFDVGAHVGNRSLALARLGARVVAVEPQTLYADLLERSMGRRLVAVERCALGAEAGTTTLHVSSRHPTVSTISPGYIARASLATGFRNVRWDERRQVEVHTLDILIDRHGLPAFCKIDVEGAEADILAGLSRPIPVIAFEYVPSVRSVALEAIDRLAALGDYRFNRVVGEGDRWANAAWCDAASMRRQILDLADEAQSGDIYAARRGSPVSAAVSPAAG